MARGKPRDPSKEQRWRQLICQWQRSGLSVRAFCERQRLALPSFYAWRRRLQERDALGKQTPAPVTFLPVHLQPDDPVPRPALELLLTNGHCLRIPHGFDAAHLREVLRALEGSPC
jgi:hypothetical protein